MRLVGIVGARVTHKMWIFEGVEKAEMVDHELLSGGKEHRVNSTLSPRSRIDLIVVYRLHLTGLGDENVLLMPVTLAEEEVKDGGKLHLRMVQTLAKEVNEDVGLSWGIPSLLQVLDGNTPCYVKPKTQPINPETMTRHNSMDGLNPHVWRNVVQAAFGRNLLLGQKQLDLGIDFLG